MTDHGMSRREMIAAALALCAVPIAAWAQPAGKVWRLGFLSSRPRPVSVEADYIGGFVRGLRERGYVEGKHVVIEWRFAGGDSERLDAFAAELVRMKVDVILAAGSPAARAAQRATSTLPIVMAGVGDPVGTRFVATLSRPGGNITGASNLAVDVSAKTLEFLAAVVPKLSRVAMILNPTNPIDPIALRQLQAAAVSARVSVSPFEAVSASQIDAAFPALARERVDALVVAPDPFFVSQARQFAELAKRHRLPTMFSFQPHVEAGGLMSYGENNAESYRRAAPYVDRILKGARPADLPVEQPTRLELVINLKTARALGISLPPALLLRADELIP